MSPRSTGVGQRPTEDAHALSDAVDDAPRQLTAGSPPSKLSQVKAALAAGDVRKALAIAAKFPRLGNHKASIERGHAAATRPEFYREIGKDPDALVADGVVALRERYGIE